MRLLFLTPQLPYPADKGTRIRNFGLIKQLGARHDLAVLSFGDPDDRRRDRRARAPLPGPGGRAAAGAAAGRSRRASAARSDPGPGPPALVGRVRRAGSRRRSRASDRTSSRSRRSRWCRTGWRPAGRADRSPSSTRTTPSGSCSSGTGRPTPGPAARSGRPTRSCRRASCRRYEGRALEAADAVVAVSAEDARALRAVGRPRRLVVVPNGVDVGGAAAPRRRAGGRDGPVHRHDGLPPERRRGALVRRPRSGRSCGRGGRPRAS